VKKLLEQRVVPAGAGAPDLQRLNTAVDEQRALGGPPDNRQFVPIRPEPDPKSPSCVPLRSGHHESDDDPAQSWRRTRNGTSTVYRKRPMPLLHTTMGSPFSHRLESENLHIGLVALAPAG